MLEAHMSRINGIMDEMRCSIHPDNERLIDCLDRLEMALQDFEQEAVENEERLSEIPIKKAA